MSTLAKMLVALGINTSEYNAGLDAAEKKASSSNINIGRSLLGGIGKIALGVGIGGLAALGTGFVASAKAGMEMNAMLEKTELQFTTLLGDADKAKQHVADLFEFAAKTPFETEPILNASKNLLTFGGQALDTMENMNLVGDAAAAVNAPIEEVSFWFGRAYSMIQAGKPFGEAAMRLQEMGLLTAESRSKMEELQKAGGSTADVWAMMTGEFGRFDGAMELQAGTWEGLMSTLSDGFKMASATAFRPFFDLAKSGLSQITALVSSDRFMGWAQQIAGFFSTTLFPSLQTIWAILQDIFVEGDIGLAVDDLRNGLSGLLPPEVIDAVSKLMLWVRDVGLPAFREFAAQVMSQLIPGLQQLWTWAQQLGAVVLPLLAQAIQWMGANMNIVLPIAAAIVAVILALSSPITLIIGLVVLFATAWANNWGGIRDKLQAVWAVVQPILALVVQWLKINIPLAIQAVSGWINNTLVPAFNAIVKAISGVITWISDLIKKFQSINLPDWLTPGSPTPFELGIRGIGDAMKDLSINQIPAFQRGLLMPAFAMAFSGGGGINADFTINAAQGQSEDLIARRVLTRLEEARRYAKAGGSYAGG